MSLRESFAARRRELLDRAKLGRTIDRLRTDGIVSEGEAGALSEGLFRSAPSAG